MLEMGSRAVPRRRSLRRRGASRSTARPPAVGRRRRHVHRSGRARARARHPYRAARRRGTSRLEIQRGFYRIATVLGQPLSLAATVDALAQAAAEAFGGSFSVVVDAAWRLAPRRRRARPAGPVARRAGGGGSPRIPTRFASPRRSVRSWPRPPWPATSGSRRGGAASGRPAGPGSLLVVPLESRDDAAGLALVFFDEEWTLGDDDLELARHLAGAGRGGARTELAVRSRDVAARAAARPHRQRPRDWSSTWPPCSTRWSSRRRRCWAPMRARSDPEVGGPFRHGGRRWSAESALGARATPRPALPARSRSRGGLSP